MSVTPIFVTVTYRVVFVSLQISGTAESYIIWYLAIVVLLTSGVHRPREDGKTVSA